MKYCITFTQRAIETSQAIKLQLYYRWGAKIVEDFETRIFKTMQLIEDSPFIFPVSNFDVNLRKGFTHKTCSVFYEVRPMQVIVHFFWDNRQEPLF